MKNHTKRTAGVLAFWLSVVCFLSAYAIERGIPTHAIVLQTVNIYSAPDPFNSSIITVFPQGERVTVADVLEYYSGGQWVKLCMQTSSGGELTGYAAAKYLQLTDGEGLHTFQEQEDTTDVHDSKYLIADTVNLSSFPSAIYEVWLIDNYGKDDNRVEVFDAPGTGSFHSKTAKGTSAYVHINEAVTLLAKDEGWGLIEYKTTTGHRRGWVPGDCVPDYAYSSIGQLPKENRAVALLEKSDMVNDVTQSNDKYVTEALHKDTVVTLLAVAYAGETEWAYIETTLSGQRARGFIHLSAIYII